MPIYEYACQDCHQEFEILRPISQVDGVPTPCEYCGSLHTDRKLSKILAVFGSGSHDEVRPSGSGCGSCSSAGSNACSSCSGG